MRGHFEIMGKERPLSYNECRIWAAEYQQTNPEATPAVRIKKDLKRGGWKCCVTFHY